MKPHPFLPSLVLVSLSVVSLLGLAPIASALAVLPPTAAHGQKSLQAINYDVNEGEDARSVGGIKTLPDTEPITAQLTVPDYHDIGLGVSPPSTSAPSTGCTKSKSTKSILNTFMISTVKATKNFPSTLYNFITATHPERHPHLARRAGAKRDLNQEDPKLSEAVDYAGKILVDVRKAILSFVEALKHAHEHEDGHVHVKRDLNEMNGMNEVNEMNEMNKDDAELKEPIEKAAEIIEMIGDFVLHAFLEVLKAFKNF